MPVITRRTMGAGLGAVVMTAGRGARADLPALETAARAEGTVTWYVAQMSGEAAEAMGHRFTRRYPGIAVSVIRTTGQVAYERLSQELKNNTPSCDVFSSTDISQYPALIRRNALAHYEPVNAAELAASYRGLGEKGFYYPTTGSLQILIYNTKTVTGADIPTRCTDLLDRKFNHRVAVAHPAFSGYFGQWVLAMRRLYGWSYFEKLAANNPRVGRSGNDPITLLNAGECVVGTGPASTSTVIARRGNPIGIVYPEDGTVLTVGPSAVIASAPHPNAARLFMEWLLSSDYADACRDWSLEPVRADAAPLPGMKPISEIKTVSLTAAEIARDLPGAIEQWRDTFGN
ncbi:MAG TPA: extracellular solute-binding protein [Acetobacteraceae bacterium]|nr:extracellular solute-binding protein [Acetobacteraceae bacterium]